MNSVSTFLFQKKREKRERTLAVCLLPSSEDTTPVCWNSEALWLFQAVGWSLLEQFVDFSGWQKRESIKERSSQSAGLSRWNMTMNSMTYFNLADGNSFPVDYQKWTKVKQKLLTIHLCKYVRFPSHESREMGRECVG